MVVKSPTDLHVGAVSSQSGTASGVSERRSQFFGDVSTDARVPPPEVRPGAWEEV